MLNAAKPSIWRAWLLVAVACWACIAPAAALTFAPGFTLRGPETRVGIFFPQSAESRQQTEPQVADSHQGKVGYGYETASGVHDYLYANADPVMGSDPSGQMTTTQLMAVVTVVGTLTTMVYDAFMRPTYAGDPSLLEGFVPIWGSGSSAFNAFEHGDYVSGSVGLISTAFEIVPLKAALSTAVKSGGKIATVVFAAGAAQLKAAVRTWPKHHIFPQAFAETFLKRYGIKIHDYVIKIPKKHHNWLHDQGDEFFKGGIWNHEWNEFLNRPGTTLDDALEFAAEMMHKYGLTEYANGIRKY